MKRSAPLKRGKPPRRKKPLPKSRKALVRRALTRKPPQARFKKGRDPRYLEWIRGLPCVRSMASCDGPIQAAHVRSRGAGGADVGNVVPLCARHHEQQHRHGVRSWAAFYFLGGLDELRRIAAEVYPKMYERSLALGFPE